MGQWLQTQGLLQTTQLQSLFREVVIQPISQLWSLPQGIFRFQSQARLPLAEMTGLSIPASALTLAGFRNLENWSRWEDQLPDPKATLLKLGASSTALQLTSLELDVWREANGVRDLVTIARKLQQPLHEVQKVSFRLHHAGLLELLDTAASLTVPGRRSWLPPIFSQAIGQVEARSPLAEPLLRVRIPSRITF
ncbi:MAG: hypothetical protein HC771_10465 [Synechococcales cyanobacterium CRU_2_2]|nr:hypothetical protein [Synechococcales cyanobacterium CRU_2_2]